MKTKIFIPLLIMALLLVSMAIPVSAATSARYQEELTDLWDSSFKVARVTFTLKYYRGMNCVEANNAINYYDDNGGFNSTQYNFPAYIDMTYVTNGEDENYEMTWEKIEYLTTKTDSLYKRFSMFAGQTFVSASAFFECNYFRTFNEVDYYDNVNFTGTETTLEISAT